MMVIGIVVSLGLPLPILVLVRVSWAWSARHRLLSVQRRLGWLRRRLARAEMVWVHTADLGLPPQQVDHEARAHGFVVARALAAPDGHAMLLSREVVPRLTGDGRRGLDGLLATVAGTALGALVTMVLASFPRDGLDLTILAMTIGLTAAIMSGVALWIFGRWAGSRSRRVLQVLREFQQSRSVLITLPAAGLHPVLVGQIAEELGFVFQGYDRMSRYFLRSMSFTPAPPSGAPRSSAGPAVR